MIALRRHPLILLFMFVFFAGVLFWSRLAGAATPDPIDHPIEFWDALSDLRTSGGLYLMLAVALASIAKAVARVLAPADGSAATGLRGRAISTLAAVALVAGALVDLLLGSLTGTGLAVAAAGAAAMVQDPRNRPASRSSAAPAVGAVLLVIAIAGCTAHQREVARAGAGAGANTALVCQTESLSGLAYEANELARHYVVSLVSGTGEVDTAALRVAARQVRTDAGRCAFAAALAAVTEAMAQRRGVLGVGPEPSYVLRRELELIARDDWRRKLIIDGEPLDDPDEGGQ